MSQPWKLLPLGAALAVLGAFLVMPGGMAKPHVANAAFECGNNQTGTLIVQIMDVSGGGAALINVGGSIVQVTPNPDTGENNLIAIDGGQNDDAPAQAGVVRFNNACRTTDSSAYSVQLIALPTALNDCDFVVATGSRTLGAGATEYVQLLVDCTDVALTPTVVPTGTVGPAATVTANASPNSVPCGGTAIVTIQVRDAQGNPVAVGTAVQITASSGNVSPSAGQTTDASGSAFVFFTASQSQHGTAKIEAKAGNATGSFDITVRNENCQGGSTPVPTATTAPPPTVTPGTITPPNTGSAGLASNGGNSSLLMAGAAILIAAIGAGAVTARARA